MRFKEFYLESKEFESYLPEIIKEEELLTELKINYTSEVYSRLVDFVKRKTAQAKDMAMFLRYQLINQVKQVTNKGKVLLFGGTVELDEPAKAYTDDMVINTVARFKKHLQGKKDIEDEDLDTIIKSKLTSSQFPWYVYVDRSRRWEPALPSARGARPAF